MRPIIALLGLLLFACQGDATPALPVDLDRQCAQTMSCRDGLLCVRLFREKIVADGGISDASNFTCHPACTDDTGCPAGYRCFRAQVAPMPLVCVRADVVDLLNRHLDGGL